MEIMTKQDKVNRLERMGYSVVFMYTGNGVILKRGNECNRVYNSVNDAFKSKVGY